MKTGYITLMLISSLVLISAGVGTVYFLDSDSQQDQEDQETASLSVSYDDPVAGQIKTLAVEDSDTGEAVPDVEVYVKGQLYGLTDQQGELSFTVPDEDYDLEVGREGYGERSVQVNVEDEVETTTEDEDTDETDEEQEDQQEEGTSDEDLEEEDGSGDEDQDESEDESEGGETEEDILQILSSYPGDGKEVEVEEGGTKEINFGVEVNSSQEGEASLVLEDETQDSKSLSSGLNDIEFVEQMSAGGYSWWIELEAGDLEEQTSEQNFEINELEDPVSVNLVSPEQDELVEGYEKEFQWSVESEESGYDLILFLNDEVRYEQSGVESTGESFQENFIIGNAGSHSWEVEVVQNGESYTESSMFETTENIPEPSLKINYPADGESLDSYDIDIEVEATSELNSTLIKEINQDQIETLDFYHGLEDESFSNQLYLEKGNHEINLSLIYNDLHDINIQSLFTETIEFETTEELPIAEAELFEPPYTQVENPPPAEEVSFAVRPFEELKVAAFIENTGTEEVEKIGEETVDGTSEHTTFNWSYPFEEDTEYEWWVEADSLESDATVKTDSNTFTWDW